MYRILGCFLMVGLSGLSLSGQAPTAASQLNPVLVKALESAGAADDTVSQSLVNTMMSIARQERRPSRQDVSGLADALWGALAGHGISDAQTSVLSQCIVDVLRGEGASNFVLASQVRATLTAMGIADVRADLIVRRFMTVGEAVRGPDDSPVRDKIAPARAK